MALGVCDLKYDNSVMFLLIFQICDEHAVSWPCCMPLHSSCDDKTAERGAKSAVCFEVN